MEARRPNAFIELELHEELQPVWPVAGQLEEVIEVAQAARLELRNDVDERVLR